jgi:hypothetical protein
LVYGRLIGELLMNEYSSHGDSPQVGQSSPWDQKARPHLGQILRMKLLSLKYES